MGEGEALGVMLCVVLGLIDLLTWFYLLAGLAL
jgi:hypothetical protein